MAVQARQIIPATARKLFLSGPPEVSPREQDAHTFDRVLLPRKRFLGSASAPVSGAERTPSEPGRRRKLIITITFRRTMTGSRTGALTIKHFNPNSPLIVSLWGTGPWVPSKRSSSQAPGSSDLAYDTLYSEMEAWNRFELTSQPDEAALIFRNQLPPPTSHILGQDNLDATAHCAQLSIRLMMKEYNGAHPHARGSSGRKRTLEAGSIVASLFFKGLESMARRNCLVARRARLS